MEGEAQERYELEEARKELGTEIVERVAKPWGRDFRRGGHPFRTFLEKSRDEKKGS